MTATGDGTAVRVPSITLAHPRARLIDTATGATLGGARLAARVDAAAAEYRRHARGIVLALLPTDLNTVVGYLGALRAGSPIALLDPGLTDAALHDLIHRYEPILVTGVAAGERRDGPPGGYEAAVAGPLGPVWRRRRAPSAAPHPALALLLTTSGSTGSPKLVRLAGSAVLANAHAIARALDIDGDEIAVTSLPLYYSYGLSVLNSHLRRGATVVLERAGLTERGFWTAVTGHGVTSLAAVPYQYEILRRLSFDPARYPTLRTLTQAGGRLRPELLLDFHARITGAGGRMYVMYGQTEAAPRITTLPWDRLPDKAGSVGPAIPGGRLTVRDDTGRTAPRPGVTGEVVFHGPNVMMGYAECAADLVRGDDLGGVLVTGDLGHLDADGYLVIIGRTRRIAKIFGVRVNLDEVERLLPDRGPLAAVPGDDRIHIFAEAAGAEARDRIRTELARRLRTHGSGIDVRHIDRLPLLATGKVDYPALAALV